MVLITASKEDGERTRYLAKDTRSASQRVLGGFGIGAPPQYCIYELDGSVDGQAILEVKKGCDGPSYTADARRRGHSDLAIFLVREVGLRSL